MSSRRISSEAGRLRAGTLALLLATAALLAGGCGLAHVHVSEPEAALYVSARRTTTWSRLNPGARWLVRRHGPGGADGESFWLIRPLHGYAFVRAEKEGFNASEPALVDFSRLGWTRVHCELKPTAALEAERQLAAGLIFLDGAWVDPVAAQLEQREGRWLSADEALAFDNRAAGLVEYDDRWMTPAERDDLLRARQLELGLVEFKSRFVTPEDEQRMRQIELQLNKMAEEFGGDDAPTSGVARLEYSGPALNDQAGIKFFVAVGFNVEVLMSGETVVDSLDVGAWDERAVEVPPGVYRLAALPATPGIGAPYYGTAELEAGRRSTLVYTGRVPQLRDLDEVLAADPTEGIHLPVIEIPDVPPREVPPRPWEGMPGVGRPPGAGRQPAGPGAGGTSGTGSETGARPARSGGAGTGGGARQGGTGTGGGARQGGTGTGGGARQGGAGTGGGSRSGTSGTSGTTGTTGTSGTTGSGSSNSSSN